MQMLCEESVSTFTFSAGEDYEPLSPSSFPLQFNQANMDQQLCAIVQIIDDLVFEPTESFFATLQPLGIAPLVGVTLLPSLTTIFILDDDEPRIGPAGDSPHTKHTMIAPHL